MTNTAGGSASNERDQSAAIASGTDTDAASAAPPSREPGPGTPYKPVYAVIAGLLVLSVIGVVAWLCVGTSTAPNIVPLYRFPVRDAINGLRIIYSLVIAALILSRRRREFALALGAAFGFCAFSNELADLNPALYAGPQASPFQYLDAGAELCTLAASVLCALTLWRRRVPEKRPAPRGRRDLDLLRRHRSLCLLVGIFGVLPQVMGFVVDSVSILVPGADEPIGCCDFTQLAGWSRVQVIGSAVVSVICVLIAVIDRSRVRSAAWLLGPALLGVVYVAGLLAEALLPTPLAAGSGLGADEEPQVTLVAGFWLILLGTLVLLAAAVILPRLRYGPRPTAASA